MPVKTMRHRAAHRFVTIFLVALVVSYGSCIFAQQTDNNAQLDIFVFNQEDHGGNKIQNEEMLYVGARASAKLKVNKVLTIRPTISGALLYAGGKPDVPSTITNATTTSASQRSSNRAGGKSDYTPVTTSMGFDIKPIGSDWTLSPGAYLPFGGWARNVESLVAEGMITGPANERRSDMPYVEVQQGAAKQQVTVNWAQASKGRIQIKVRMDNPD